MKHEITNDFKLDAIKDNFKPPKMGEMSEDTVIELFERTQLNLQCFYDYVYYKSEYYTDKGKKFYLVKDVAIIIRELCNLTP